MQAGVGFLVLQLVMELTRECKSMSTSKRFLMCFTLLWIVSSVAWAEPWMGNLEIYDNSIWKAGHPGNYGTVKFFLNEVSGEVIPIKVYVQVNSDGHQPTELEVQVFTNVNRRDQAKVWENPEEAGGQKSYYMTYPMHKVGQIGNNFVYLAELSLEKTGAYRLTTRFRIKGGNWLWNNDFESGGVKQRDCAVIISPRKVLSLTMYEVNPLVVKARMGGGFDQRSTFDDFMDHSGQGVEQFNLRFIRDKLGFNVLWIMPIFPVTLERWDPEAKQIVPNFSPGSPYASRNYYAVNECLSRANDSDVSLKLFQSLVAEAKAIGLDVFIDVAFNHAGRDIVFGKGAADIGLISDSDVSKSIRNMRPAWFSSKSNFRKHAISADDAEEIYSPADRRGEHKWYDASLEWYFGDYSSLGPKPNYGNTSSGGALDERDLFYTDLNPDGGYDIEVKNVFNYFARVLSFWLEQTNNNLAGIRADFAQGLPPQAWEYIINKTRQKKWDFIFLAEALDPDIIRYRVNRSFDVLTTVDHWMYRNNDITMSQLVQSLEGEASLYGYNAAIMHNGTSHDEDGNDNAWLMMARYAVASASHGLSMIYMTQPLGISSKIDFQCSWQNLVSYWENANPNVFDMYGRINRAREEHSALRSTNRYFLKSRDKNNFNEDIFSVAKWDEDDLVFIFVNLRNSGVKSEVFAVPTSVPLQLDASYQIVNLVADDPNQEIWQSPRLGKDIYRDGIYVQFKFPNEVQYLLLKRR